MKFRGFSLLSCMLIYVAVILFTFCGSQIGETHNSEELHKLYVRGNTSAQAFGQDGGEQDLYLDASGDGFSPTTVDGNVTSAYFDLEATVTGKPSNGSPVFRFGGGRAFASVSNHLSEIDEATAKVSLYATMSFTAADNIFVTSVVHHH